MTGRMTRTARSILAAAVVATAVLAAPAAAQTDTWTVTPGGGFAGGGQATVIVDGSGSQWNCDTVTVNGTAKSGSGLANPLATIPETTGIQFGDCPGQFGFTVSFTQVGDWRLVCDSHDGDVVHCRIVDVVIDLSSPGCAATIAGYLNVTYTNSTGVLRILPDYTLQVTFVDPAADCLGLIARGQSVAVDAVFVITPPMTITSP